MRQRVNQVLKDSWQFVYSEAIPLFFEADTLTRVFPKKKSPFNERALVINR
jgi:hypothetical protein